MINPVKYYYPPSVSCAARHTVYIYRTLEIESNKPSVALEHGAEHCKRQHLRANRFGTGTNRRRRFGAGSFCAVISTVHTASRENAYDENFCE